MHLGRLHGITLKKVGRDAVRYSSIRPWDPRILEVFALNLWDFPAHHGSVHRRDDP